MMFRKISLLLAAAFILPVCAQEVPPKTGPILQKNRAHELAPVVPDDDAGTGSNDSLTVQAARSVHVLSRGKGVAYQREWDLSGLPSYVPEENVNGTIRVWGLNYIGDSPLAEYWADEFRRFHPGATIEYHLPTALTAIPALITGAADIGANDALWFFQRLEFRKAMGYDPTEIRMVTGSFDVPGWANALGIFVHKSNPLSKVSIAQLDGIFGAERDGGWADTTWRPDFARGPEKNIRMWGQLGLTGEWADKPIHVYGLNLRYHQAVGMSDAILGGSDKWNEDLRMYANYARKDGTLAVAAGNLMKDLANDPLGIAYSGMQNLNPSVKVLPVAIKDGGPFIDLTLENVHNRTYPFASEQFWDLKLKPGERVDPKVREFIRYVISRQGQQQVVRDGKFLPLTPELARAGLETLETGKRPSMTILSSHATPSPNKDETESNRVQGALAAQEHKLGVGAHYHALFNLDSIPPYQPNGRVAGALHVWGLSTLSSGNLAKYWTDGFRRYHPDVTFDWHLSAGNTAIASLITGAGDLGVGDKLRFSDVLAYQRMFNRNPVELQLATGAFDVPGWGSALSIHVHPSNPLGQISIQQLDGVFGAQRSGGWIDTSWHSELARGADRNIRTWGQLGLTGEWADKPIHVYGPEPRREESIRFSDTVLKGGDKWNGQLHIFSDKVGAAGQIITAGQQIAQAVAADPYGIGYYENQPASGMTKLLAVAATPEGRFIPLTIDNVQNRAYPLALSTYWYFNAQTDKPVDPKLREFLRYVMSREGQEEVVRDGKYLPLTPETAEKQLGKLN